MAQSIFIPKTSTPEILVNPLTDAVSKATEATQGMSGLEILYWVL